MADRKPTIVNPEAKKARASVETTMVSRLWECFNFRKDNELISLDMILIDEEHDVMHGTIPKNRVVKFKNQIREGQIYLIKNVKVIPCAATYKPIEGAYCLEFLMNTSIEEIKEVTIAIPEFKFQFAGINDLHNRKHDTSLLSGRHLEFHYGKKFQKKIDESLLMRDDKSIVIIITSTNVKEFQGKIYLNSTSGSRIYINLEIDKVHLLQRNNENIPVVKLQKRKLNEISVEEEMFQNRVSLKYLTSLLWYNWDRITEYTIKAKIVGVNGKFGWCYLSCSVYKKKIPDMNSNNFYCVKCNKEIKFPQMRFKVDIVVTNGTVESAFIMFDLVCQKLVGLSCSQLLKTQENNHKRIPDVVNAFCGKTFVFKIKLSETDLKQGYES
ncbi:uncharacterized protein LOC116115697 [Pistacia vera]|uniref:uncharacterized protein LOC116115697 n=1 Tax=Pistacia vera TaxID=55513 RepID=UPI0012631EC8|nr:uncharacterized protein LOC116115697 [Pistacia vera]